jgi:hypothetical protein
MVFGLLALIPQMSLKISSDVQFGATADAIVNSVKMTNVPVMIHLRPYVSDRGPKNIGPTT